LPGTETFVGVPGLTIVGRESSEMSQSETFDPGRLLFDLPTCPGCGANMWLVQIEPDAPSHDKRSFECPHCGYVLNQTVKYR